MLDKFWVKVLLSVLVFGCSFAAYYYPIHVKGYPVSVGFGTLAKARNFAVSGTYNYESPDGVLLSSERVGDAAVETAVLNPLNPIIYGHLFKYANINSIDLLTLVYLAVILAAISNVIIFFLMVRLFGTATGFISVIIMALFPLRVVDALTVVYSEFGMLFFAIALWLYLGSKQGPFEAGKLRLTFFSVFFALTALARNAFLISFPVFVLYDFYKNRSYKRVLLLILPFLVIFGSTLTPFSWLGAPNGYLAGFESQPSGLLGEVFPDPYTAHYDRENFIENLQGTSYRGINDAHFLKQWGYDVSVWEQFKSYLGSAVFYLKESMSLTTFGGPLIVLFMCIGAYWLYYNKKDILFFFLTWLVLWFLGLVYYQTSNRGHYLQIMIILASLAGLGIYQLLKQLGLSTVKKSTTALLLLFLTIGHLAYANKWKLFEAYESTKIEVMVGFAKELKADDLPEGTVAANINTTLTSILHYFLDKDTVYFAQETVEKLVEEGRLKEAFDIYGVHTAIGFSEKTSQDIKRLTSIDKVISDSFLEE